MQINDTLLNKLEKLSALQIADEKREEVLNQLNEIVYFVEKLNELDLSTTEATVNTLSGGTPFREDKARSGAVIEGVFTHAPGVKERFFLVPKIIE